MYREEAETHSPGHSMMIYVVYISKKNDRGHVKVIGEHFKHALNDHDLFPLLN